MRVLVTGAAGFLGPHVMEAARDAWPGAEIAAIDLRPAAGADRMLVGDLRQPTVVRAMVAAESPEVVLHLAGILGGTLEELYDANVRCTENLLAAVAAEAPEARVVVTGSAAEYGAVPADELPVVEDRAPSPLSHYGLSKTWQTACALYHANTDVDVTVGRIFQMLGPNMPESLFAGSVCAQLARIAEGAAPAEVRVGDLEARRDFLDVSDVATALVALAAKGGRGDVHNICRGESVTMAELLDIMVDASGLEVRVVRDPQRARPSDVPDSRGSHGRLTRATGWQPSVTVARSAAAVVREAVGRG